MSRVPISRAEIRILKEAQAPHNLFFGHLPKGTKLVDWGLKDVVKVSVIKGYGGFQFYKE